MVIQRVPEGFLGGSVEAGFLQRIGISGLTSGGFQYVHRELQAKLNITQGIHIYINKRTFKHNLKEILKTIFCRCF